MATVPFCVKPAAWGPTGPGANRDAVFLPTRKQAPCVCRRTDRASDKEPGAGKSARRPCGADRLPTVAGQPRLGGRPGDSADGRRHQDGQGAYGGAVPWLGVVPHTCCPEPQAATPPDRVRRARSQGGTLRSPALHPGLTTSQDQHPRLWAPLGALVQSFPQVSRDSPDSHRRPCVRLQAQQDWSQWQKWPSGALRPSSGDIRPAGHHWGPRVQALGAPWLE